MISGKQSKKFTVTQQHNNRMQPVAAEPRR
jgi:hypothetical protein